MNGKHPVKSNSFNADGHEDCGCHPTKTQTEDDFCIPEGCPERMDSPVFSSPTSCLSEDRLHQLENKIEHANRLLLDLALSSQQPEKGRRILFKGLVGRFVIIKIKCGQSNEKTESAEGNSHESEQSNTEQGRASTKIHSRSRKKRLRKKQRQKLNKKNNSNKPFTILEGKVQLVGRDFVQLLRDGREMIVPFSKICVVRSRKRYHPVRNKADLENIDSCIRRELTFNFGETVANDPELVHLFYGLNLSSYLKGRIGRKLTIIMEKEHTCGVLGRIDEESIEVACSTGDIIMLSQHSVCYINI